METNEIKLEITVALNKNGSRHSNTGTDIFTKSVSVITSTALNKIVRVLRAETEASIKKMRKSFNNSFYGFSTTCDVESDRYTDNLSEGEAKMQNLIIAKSLNKTATLIIALAIMFTFNSCNDSICNMPQENTGSIHYIIGYCTGCGYAVDTSNGIGKANIYLAVSEDLKDTLAIPDLPDNLFNFPSKILYPAWINGFNLFPEEYRFTYKVKMNYEVVEDYYILCHADKMWLYDIRAKLISIKPISIK